MDVSDYLRLEIIRTKVSKGINLASVRIQIASYIDDSNATSPPALLSEICKLKAGTVFKIPCGSSILKLVVHLSTDSSDIQIVLGSGAVEDISKLNIDRDSVHMLSAYIFNQAGTSTKKISKVHFKAEYRSFFSKNEKVSLTSTDQKDTSNRLVLPNFRFQQLSRKVNWDKVRSLNLMSITDKTDISSLLSCFNDIVHGDFSAEDVDSKLLHAVQLSQFSAQYLNASADLLRGKEKLLSSAVRTFRDEEDKLDLEIAKMKARNKSLLRESLGLDELLSQYSDLLQSLDPELAEKFERESHAKTLQEAYECEKARSGAREEEVEEKRAKERMRQIEFENILMQERQKENVLKRKIELEKVRLRKLALEEQLRTGTVPADPIWADDG